MANKFLNGIDVTSTGSFTGQVTIPETPTADAHAASKKYVDDQITTGVDVAKRIEISVKNISGGELTKGTVVHAAPSASPPNGNVVEVIAADYDAEANMPAIGILNETLADDAEGVAVMMGAVSGIDTDDFTAGDELYVGADGALTNTKPQTAGQLIQKIAVCVKSHASNGLIKVFGAGRSNDVPLPLYIDNTNQRLGIGTPSPDYLLDLYKSTDTTSGSIGTTLQRLWNYVGSDLNQQKTFIDFVFQDDNDNEYPQVRIGAEVGQNGNSDTQPKEGSGAFVVYTNNATGDGPGTPTGLAERFRVDYIGNVGIGTTSPDAKLHVAGDSTAAAFSTVLKVESTADEGSLQDIHIYNQYDRDVGIKFETLGGENYIWQDSNSDDALIISTGGSSRANDAALILEQDQDVIVPNGKLGVGATSPSAKLDVKGDGADFFLRSEDYKIARIQPRGTGADLDKGLFSLFNGDTESVRIDTAGSSWFNGGNVGIGVTSPTAAKLVVSSDTAPQLLIKSPSTGSSAAQILLEHNDGVTQNASITFDQSSQNTLTIATGYQSPTDLNRINIAPAGDVGLTVRGGAGSSSGNVGIGTTSPTHLLNLSESDSNSVQLVIDNTNTTDAGTETSEIRFTHYRSYVAGQNDAGEIIVGKEQAWDAAGDRNSYMSFGTRKGSDAVVEKMRITSAGGISFGSTGTAYGSSGQVLTSAGNATPTWETPTTGTVTGTGAVNQVAFWDGTSSLSGDNSLYWDSTNEHFGIGDSTPGSKLKVLSGVNETSNYTVDISHVRNDADVATTAMRINMDLSGADTTTTDRTSSGLFLDLDSSADGDASNEHRIRGINSDVRFTGFSDTVQSGYFLAESNNSTEKTALLMGLQAQASHDSSSTNGGVSNMYGVYGVASIQDLGDVDNAYGGLFISFITSARGAANVGITKGVEGRVTIDKAETINYGAMTAVSGIIDNNEGTFPTFGAQYLFKGDYQGTKGDNAFGIYTEGDRHYFDGNIGIGTTNATSRLTVQENGITTKIATVTIGDTIAGASLTLRGGSPTIYFDRTGTDPENKILMDSSGLEFKTGTLDAEGDVDFKITANGDLQLSKGAKISNQENTDIDSAAAEVVAEVAISYTAAFFDFVVKKGTNVRSGTVYACHDGTNVEFTETSTNDLGDTSDVTLSVDKTSTNLRLIATVTSDDWSVKSLIRAI